MAMSDETRRRKTAERKKRWREKNREEYLAQRKAYRVRHREELAAKQRKRTARDPEKYRAIYRKWYDAKVRPTDTERKVRTPEMIAADIKRQMKICTICRHDLPFEAFRAHQTSPDGKDSRCKACQAEQQMAYAKKQQEADPEGWRLKRHAATVLSKYGLTTEQYQALLTEQGGGCAICGRPPEPEKVLPIDHDHACCPGNGSCGECVRGLLCVGCNQGVGAFEDDPNRLEAAAAYLRR